MRKIVSFLLCVLFLPILSSCKSENKTLPKYQISITLNEDMTIEGYMEYFFVCEEDLTKFCFNLYPNAFKDGSNPKPVFESDFLSAYPNGFSEGKIDVLSVKALGSDANFEVGGVNEQTLTVFFDKEIQKGEKASVYVEFKTTLPNVNHRFGYGENTVNLTAFYPMASVYQGGDFKVIPYYPSGDPFYTECADYSLSITVPSTYSIASSLTPTGTVWSGGETEYLYERKNVRDIALIMSENYEITKCESGGVNIYYYYYVDENPEKTLEIAKKSLDYFSKNYYAYPYKEYVVCEADFLYGGMEYPCLSLISDSVKDYRDYTVVHETAHQWFYGIVGVDQSEIGYLDEGLTEFATVSFLNDSGYGEYKDYAKKAEIEYLAIKDALVRQGITTPPIMERNLKDFTCEAEYVMIAYKRSFLAIDRLKTYMGDKKFNKALKNFVEKYAFSEATTQDFISCFDKKKRGAGSFFKEFVSGVA